MNRKSLALLIVLMSAGLAPATAIIGFCARMPCCRHAAPLPLAFTGTATDCCTTIACYESPSARLGTTTVLSQLVVATPVVEASVKQLPAVTATVAPIDTSPPRATPDRLAQLSILLI